MKFDSKLFDAIRIRPRREEPVRIEIPPCGWEGCDQPGAYKAPKGHRAEGQYHHFCLEHVRHYNTAFNHFAGMSREELEEALHAPPRAETRSSFAAGAQPGGAARAARESLRPGERFGDPFGVFARYRWRQGKAEPRAAERVRPLNEPDRRALETLGITGRAEPAAIKLAYKELVKIHHPDANGGDRSSEDRLRAIIAAYSHLKKAGFVPR